MSSRRTIGRNPLDALATPRTAEAAEARPQASSAGAPHPLDILIPGAPGERSPVPAVGAGTAPAPVEAAAAAPAPAELDPAETATFNETDVLALAPGPAETAVFAEAEPAVEPALAAPGKHLVFDVAGEKLAIEVVRVREIAGYGAVSRVPGAPAFVRGVTNLRGNVVPVIDLARRLGLATQPVTSRTSMVMVEAGFAGERLVVAVVVDGVSDVVDLSREAIAPSPSLGSLRVELFSGLARQGGQLFLILDTDRILEARALAAQPSEPAGTPGPGDGSGQPAVAG